jgi:hypothetical protein
LSGRGLNQQVQQRREGDLFWSIAHGVPATPMPGFSPPLDDAQVWALIQFLDAQAAAQNAMAMTDRLAPLRPVPAPDFTYELPGRPQASLLQQGNSAVTLMVLYTVPSSLPRLRELAAQQSDYVAAGARVVALPMPASPAATLPGTPDGGAWLLAFASPAVASTYALFARGAPAAPDGAPTHIEYLVDRFGFLRVRRIGVAPGAPGSSGSSRETLRQIGALMREPARLPVQWGHRH